MSHDCLVRVCTFICRMRRQMPTIRGKTLSHLLRHGLELSVWFATSGGLQLFVAFRATSHR